MGFGRTAPDRRLRTVGRLAVAIAVAALLAHGSAAAQAPPGDISGVDQYIELLPEAGGSTPTGSGGGDRSGGRDKGAAGKPLPLSPAAQRELGQHGGSDAPLLEAIATSPDFGAPGAGLRRSIGSTSDDRGGASADDSQGGAGGGARGDGAGGGARGESRPAGAMADGSAAPGAAEALRDVSFGEPISSAVGAIADTEDGGAPSPLFLALLAISAVLVSAAVWRARRNRA